MRPMLITAVSLLALLPGAAVLAAQAPIQSAGAQPADAGSSNGPSATLAADAATKPPAIPEGESQVRIVRLSEVKGDVDLDRGNNGFEPASLNLPIVQGSRLQTGMGLAEVEFEDNSSLRLTPNTEVEFTHLALERSGSKVSAMRVRRGTVYLSTTDTKGNTLTLHFGKNELAVPPSTHLELSVGDPDATLRVLNGTAAVTSPAGTVNVSKKKALTLNLTDPQAAPLLADNREPGTYDKWDKNAVEYHSARANAAFGSGYGASDLAYYGSFVNLGGSCGSLWQPYFLGAGWNPYSNGVFAWYPGTGYSWVSPYQWGWTPFHSGSWMNCGAAGWGWQPGAQWYGLRNLAAGSGGALPGRPGAPANGFTGTGLRPRPPLPPGQHGTTMISVSSRPLPVSRNTAEGFEFRAGSAGLGVPRQTFGKLNHVASDVTEHGVAMRGSAFTSAPGVVVHSNVMPATAAGYAPGSAAAGTHPGYAPGNASAGAHPGYTRTTSASSQPVSNTSSTGSFHNAAPASAPAASAGSARGH